MSQPHKHQPFTMTHLRDVIMSNRELYDAAKSYSMLLAASIDRAARYTAKANADWHDDPAADDHADFHAPDAEQFPREVRHACALDVLEYFLEEFHMKEPAPEIPVVTIPPEA